VGLMGALVDLAMRKRGVVLRKAEDLLAMGRSSIQGLVVVRVRRVGRMRFEEFLLTTCTY
jgi:hypothetical protein